MGNAAPRARLMRCTPSAGLSKACRHRYPRRKPERKPWTWRVMHYAFTVTSNSFYLPRIFKRNQLLIIIPGCLSLQIIKTHINFMLLCIQTYGWLQLWHVAAACLGNVLESWTCQYSWDDTWEETGKRVKRNKKSVWKQCFKYVGFGELREPKIPRRGGRGDGKSNGSRMLRIYML